MSKIIGLCGGSGSGKGIVASFFAENGYLTIDTDKVYREVTDKSSNCLDALVCEFGPEILNIDGSLNRKWLGEIVFSDKKKLSALNTITHRFILDRVRTIINDSANVKYKGFVVDAPLLYESGFDKECDFVVAVLANIDIRIDRIVVRDGISREAAIKRISSQITDERLRTLADFTVENNGNLLALREEVNEIIRKIN